MASRRSASPATPARTPRAGGAVARRSDELNPQQRAFVDNYSTPGSATFGNGTQSAIVAGYSPKTAAQQASALLRNPKVQEAIERRFEEAGIKHAEIRARLGQIARFDASAFITFDVYEALVDKPTPVAEAARLARADFERAVKAERRVPRTSQDLRKAASARLDALEMRAVELELQAEDEPDAVVLYPHREMRRVPRVDLAAAADAGLLHLVAGIGYDKQGRFTVDLPDAQSALVHLDKMHALAAAKGEDPAVAADAQLAGALAKMGALVGSAQTVNLQIVHNHAPVGAQTP